jgi:hypothetical protein
MRLKNTVHHIALSKRGSNPDAVTDDYLRKNQLLSFFRICDQSSFKDFDTLAPNL